MSPSPLPAGARQARVRGAGAVDALRGGPVGPPLAVRRWPWALAAALLGAAAGAALVLGRRALVGEDAPDALDPLEVKAVVDTGSGLPPA